MTRKKLSLIIPVFNESAGLAACLESVGSQTQPADEVIVVDNNSTDDTAEIASSFDFVKLLKEPVQGAVQARNRGFNYSSGDIIARIDADTRLPKNWVKNVLGSMDETGADAVCGPASGYDLPAPSINWLPHHLLCLFLRSFCPQHPFLFGFNMALRRSAWQKIKQKVCDDKYMHEDLDLAIHLKQSGYRLSYDRNIRVSASGRRYNDHWPDFHFYMKTYARTYRRHGINDVGMYLAIAAYYLGYFFYRPWTFRRLPRKNPMGV